MVHKERFE